MQDHDKEAFFAQLKENLLKFGNIPLKKETYVSEDQTNELAKLLMLRS